MTLRIEDADGVRLVTWDRPESLNAMSLELWDGTRDALLSAAGDGIRCVVLTGTGRAFTVGQDLAEMTDPRHADESRGFRGVMSALVASDVPLIAAVNGLAVGFGTTVLPWCDIVLVSDAARFRVPFVGLGVTTEAGSSVTLPAVMGARAAARFVLTGDWLSAEEAVAVGLASRCVPADQLLPEAMALAGRLAAQPPDALRTTTRLLRVGRTDAWLAAMERENAEFARLAGGPENQAAIEAFFSRS
jgi:enoyl-CoA hydratase/carnithine racemase